MDGKTKKEKYHLRLPETNLLYMAGLYNTYKDSKTGLEGQYFVILTMAANESVAPIHDRMPVILYPDRCNDWMREGCDISSLFAQRSPDLLMERVG